MKVVAKIFKGVDIIWNILLTFVVLTIVGVRFVPLLFGYEPVVCLSNSMAPTFYEGALCYIDTNYDLDSIEVGDVIAFELNNGSKVTHRVHQFTGDGMYITKGDANEDVDIAPISKEQIIGENVLQIPHIGDYFKEFPNKPMVTLLVFCAVVSICLSIIKSLLKEDLEDVKKSKGEEKSDLSSSDTGSSDC